MSKFQLNLDLCFNKFNAILSQWVAFLEATFTCPPCMSQYSSINCIHMYECAISDGCMHAACTMLLLPHMLPVPGCHDSCKPALPDFMSPG